MDSLTIILITIGIILTIALAVVMFLAPIIIISQLNSIKSLLGKINKNLSTNTAERDSSESEYNYTNDNQRTRDLMKSLFNDEKNASDR